MNDLNALLFDLNRHLAIFGKAAQDFASNPSELGLLGLQIQQEEANRLILELQSTVDALALIEKVSA